MTFDFSDKVVLVTGASRGIGNTIALSFGQAGATVIGTATSQAGADKISKLFDDKQIQGSGKVLNVTQQENIDELLTSITSEFAAPSILINNAGINQDNLLMRMKQDEWDNVINTNLNAIFKMTKACIRPMIKARWGRVINISSVSGFIGNPGQTNYCASKMGVVGFSRSLAREIASRNVTVNVVAPGFIQTEMTDALSDEQQQQLKTQIPMQRIGSTDEIAATVQFLASQEAAYITGETIHVNGGLYMG